MSKVSVLAALTFSLASCGQRETEHEVVNSWLKKHPEYRLAADADCGCVEDLARIRQEVSDYHPYAAHGDFNNDDIPDSAFVMVRKVASNYGFALLVFNGPFVSDTPAFFEAGMELNQGGLSFDPQGPKPHRLWFSQFGTDSSVLEPNGSGYVVRTPIDEEQ